MSNDIALNEKGEVVHSSDISKLDNCEERIKKIDENYTCPDCKTKMTYAQRGNVGYFKHQQSTPSEIKERCYYYSGLLTDCPKDTYLLLEKKKREVELFLEINNVEGYKVITYYSEKKLAEYLKKHPSDDFIIVGNKIDEWTYAQLERNVLILKMKALVKYITVNNKKTIHTFVGTKPDSIFLLKFTYQYKREAHFEPYVLSIKNLLKKDFSFRGRLMEQSDVLDFTPKQKI
jgi:hypothetical protein